MTFPPAHHCNARLQALVRRTRADGSYIDHSTQQPKKTRGPPPLLWPFSGGSRAPNSACSFTPRALVFVRALWPGVPRGWRLCQRLALGQRQPRADLRPNRHPRVLHGLLVRVQGRVGPRVVARALHHDRGQVVDGRRLQNGLRRPRVVGAVDVENPVDVRGTPAVLRVGGVHVREHARVASEVGGLVGQLVGWLVGEQGTEYFNLVKIILLNFQTFSFN